MHGIIAFFKRLYRFLKKYPLFNQWYSFITKSLIYYKYGPNWSNPEVKHVAIFWKFSNWKHEFTIKYFPKYKHIFVNQNTYLVDLIHSLYKAYDVEKITIYVWGKSAPTEVYNTAKKYDIELITVEDGFLRSIQNKSFHVTPLSLVVDKTGIYFDAQVPSDLENILNNYEFSQDFQLLEQADQLIELFHKYQLTKYYPQNSLPEMFKHVEGYNILIIGQAEKDASIKYGSTKVKYNSDIIRQAHQDYPNAHIFYRPHPDVAIKGREKLSSPEKLGDICTILNHSISLHDVMLNVDHIYTISSLVGMEALINGKKVTTLGAPFYSGWGLTDDRQLITRRKRLLSLRELVAGAYLLYPTYFNPDSGSQTDAISIAKYLIHKRHGHVPEI